VETVEKSRSDFSTVPPGLGKLFGFPTVPTASTAGVNIKSKVLKTPAKLFLIQPYFLSRQWGQA
jgi:hypothetical protein